MKDDIEKIKRYLDNMKFVKVYDYNQIIEENQNNPKEIFKEATGIITEKIINTIQNGQASYKSDNIILTEIIMYLDDHLTTVLHDL